KRIPANGHVCFTPESGHVQCNTPCPLWANSGHSPCLFDHFVGSRGTPSNDDQENRSHAAWREIPRALPIVSQLISRLRSSSIWACSTARVASTVALAIFSAASS